jgi:biotin synthase
MDLVTKLATNRILTSDEFQDLMLTEDAALRAKLFRFAQQVTAQNFHNKVYIRGLIEFTTHCQRDCFYCGLRCSNKHAERYRLTKKEILECCKEGYALGFRTFILQGGEDHFFTDNLMCDIIYAIKNLYQDCAVTLSIGERSLNSYKMFYDAGADRYLLRHETANSLHYSRLHPPSDSLEARKESLYNLKELGYQVGTGVIVGSPYQLTEYFAEDLAFIKELDPAIVDIAPFIPNKDTPFRHQTPGTLEDTLRLLAILRLMLPRALIPAAATLAALHPNGRQHGILSGANEVLPNLTPANVRGKYFLYNNKANTQAEKAENLRFLNAQMKNMGYELCIDRGDYISETLFKK